MIVLAFLILSICLIFLAVAIYFLVVEGPFV